MGEADAADVVADLCVAGQRQEAIYAIVCAQAQQMFENRVAPARIDG